MKHFGIITASLAFAAMSCDALGAASPLSPEQELATFQLADTNLIVELVAAEPDVRAPVAIAWDADGRMFVAEMTDYPSGPVNGRIRMLEDRDGDGRYESAIIFATNLAYPNGVMAWKNGVLVTAAPDLWFLADTNGDGRADVREKVLTGFTEGNQQLRVNGLFWGLDNWIYGCNGRSDGEVKWADGTPAGSIRRRDFRFRPDTKQFEVIAGNSQFGMGYDDWGNRFPVFNNTPIRHVVMEDRYLERQPSLAGTDVVPSISPKDGNRVFALTPPTLLIPQPVGFFTSACGPSVFRGTALPESYRGNYFVCEPVQNVVQRRVLKPNGSTFIAEYADASDSPLPSTGRGARGEGWERRDALDNANTLAPNHPSPSIPLPVEGRGKPEAPREFLASTDRWFHGVFTATGPDGAFYIVDFYRDLVEHPHWVAPEIRDKVDWRKGEEHGRIWRIRAKDVKLAKVEKLSRASNNELVRALESANGWTRDTAQRLLAERDAQAVMPELKHLLRSSARIPTRIHALNLLALWQNDGASVGLNDTHPRVREQAWRLLEARPAAARQSVIASTRSADARERLQAVWTAGRVLESGALLPVLTNVVTHPEFDVWQGTAVLAVIGTNAPLLWDSLLPMLANTGSAQVAFLERLASLTAPNLSEAQARRSIGFLHGAMQGQLWGILAELLRATPDSQRAALAEYAGGLRVASFAEEIALRESSREADRVNAVRLFVLLGGDAGASSMTNLLSRAHPEALQALVVKALADSKRPADVSLALTRWRDIGRSARQQIISAALRTPDVFNLLVDELEAKRIPAVEVDPAARQSILKLKDSPAKARAVGLLTAHVSADREAVVAKYRPALKLTGDRKHGAEVFEHACLVCHQMQGLGASVGPDLSGIGTHSRETLLVEILDPSRQVLPDFVAYHAETKGGNTYTGFIANESATTVTLRRANEPDITLPRAELKEFKTSGQSLMPEGLEAGLGDQDVADLIEFLRRPDRTLFSQSK